LKAAIALGKKHSPNAFAHILFADRSIPRLTLSESVCFHHRERSMIAVAPNPEALEADLVLQIKTLKATHLIHGQQPTINEMRPRVSKHISSAFSAQWAQHPGMCTAPSLLPLSISSAMFP
jgi:hypothetical protein